MLATEDRFSQQLKKGVLEMLVLGLVCAHPTYGYELLSILKERSDGLLNLKEGTLYPILYRLEDEELITASWTQPEGRSAPKKVYAATQAGRQEYARRRTVWSAFVQTVNAFGEGAEI